MVFDSVWIIGIKANVAFAVQFVLNFVYGIYTHAGISFLDIRVDGYWRTAIHTYLVEMRSEAFRPTVEKVSGFFVKKYGQPGVLLGE
jgi:hypothetical protein